MPKLAPDQEKRLLDAADALRKPLALWQCTHFQSLLNINNTYLLNLYAYLEQQSAAYCDKGPKMALYQASYDYILRERKSAPMAYLTPNATFCDNLCQMLNLPFFEDEMAREQIDPAMKFTQNLWAVYCERAEALRARI